MKMHPVKKIKVQESIKTDKKLFNAAQKHTDEDLMEIVDEETFESTPQSNMDLPLIMQGLDVPSQTRGPFSKIDRQRWQLVVENMLVKGIKSGREISRLTGLSAMTANTLVKEVKEAMSSDVTPTRINQTRELLYTENETISQFCWQLVNADPTANNVPQLLKIIGDTNTRRSRLMGVENINLNVGDNTRLNHFDIDNAQRQAAAKLNVSVDALKELGDAIATKMLSAPTTTEQGESDE
jgi:hypothetical protein